MEKKLVFVSGATALLAGWLPDLGKDSPEPRWQILTHSLPSLLPSLSCLPLLKALDKVRKSGQIIYFNPSLSFLRPCAIQSIGGGKKITQTSAGDPFQMWNQSPLYAKSLSAAKDRGGDEFLCGF